VHQNARIIKLKFFSADLILQQQDDSNNDVHE